MKTPKTYRLSDIAVRGLNQLREWYPASTETELVEEAISYRVALGQSPAQNTSMRALKHVIAEYEIYRERARDLYDQYLASISEHEPDDVIERWRVDYEQLAAVETALMHLMCKMCKMT